jgi:hypothetical protein
MMMVDVMLAGAIRGLVSEGEWIIKEIHEFRPDTVALSISKEGLIAMRSHLDSGAEEAGLDNLEEEIYVAGLEAFGEVRKPPPCFAGALNTAVELGIQVEPLDLDDEEYTNAYCRNISTLEVISQGRCQRRIARHRFQARSAEEFVLEFDEIVNRQKGFQKLEVEREEHMATEVARLASNRNCVLAIIEIERLQGVVRALEDSGNTFEVLER